MGQLSRWTASGKLKALGLFDYYWRKKGMRILLVSVLSIFLAGSGVFAASPDRTDLQGQYVEARNADVYTAACFANSEVGLMGDLAVFGWRIDKGAFQGVKLDGLGVVAVVKAKGTLGDIHSSAYPVKSVLIIDDRANTEQRAALKSFAQQMGGDLLQDIVRVHYQPISLYTADGDIHSRQVKLTAGQLASVETRALDEGDKICHNESVWYTPLTRLDHAMPAYTLAHQFSGEGLQATWSSPYKRSAFVGTFRLQE